jgi:hypothetical protein
MGISSIAFRAKNSFQTTGSSKPEPSVLPGNLRSDLDAIGIERDGLLQSVDGSAVRATQARKNKAQIRNRKSRKAEGGAAAAPPSSVIAQLKQPEVIKRFVSTREQSTRKQEQDQARDVPPSALPNSVRSRAGTAVHDSGPKPSHSRPMQARIQNSKPKEVGYE